MGRVLILLSLTACGASVRSSVLSRGTVVAPELGSAPLQTVATHFGRSETRVGFHAQAILMDYAYLSAWTRERGLSRLGPAQAQLAETSEQARRYALGRTSFAVRATYETGYALPDRGRGLDLRAWSFRLTRRSGEAFYPSSVESPPTAEGIEVRATARPGLFHTYTSTATTVYTHLVSGTVTFDCPTTPEVGEIELVASPPIAMDPVSFRWALR